MGIGNAPSYAHMPLDTFSGDGTTTGFTLTQNAITNSVIVHVGGVYSAPSVGYTISGGTITFTSPPVTGTNNITVLHLGVAVEIPTPADSSVTPTKLSSGQFGGAYIKLSDVKTSGTAGGTSSSTTTHVRTLNTEDNDAGNHCELSSNQFTLDAGTYRVQASAPSYKSNQTKLRLYDVTGAAYIIEGVSLYSNSADNVSLSPALHGEFTITSSNVFEIRHYISAGYASSGLGNAVSQGSEVYTVVELWKVK